MKHDITITIKNYEIDEINDEFVSRLQEAINGIIANMDANIETIDIALKAIPRTDAKITLSNMDKQLAHTRVYMDKYPQGINWTGL